MRLQCKACHAVLSNLGALEAHLTAGHGFSRDNARFEAQSYIGEEGDELATLRAALADAEQRAAGLTALIQAYNRAPMGSDAEGIALEAMAELGIGDD